MCVCVSTDLQAKDDLDGSSVGSEAVPGVSDVEDVNGGQEEEDGDGTEMEGPRDERTTLHLWVSVVCVCVCVR